MCVHRDEDKVQHAVLEYLRWNGFGRAAQAMVEVVADDYAVRQVAHVPIEHANSAVDVAKVRPHCGGLARSDRTASCCTSGCTPGVLRTPPLLTVRPPCPLPRRRTLARACHQRELMAAYDNNEPKQFWVLWDRYFAFVHSKRVQEPMPGSREAAMFMEFYCQLKFAVAPWLTAASDASAAAPGEPSRAQPAAGGKHGGGNAAARKQGDARAKGGKAGRDAPGGSGVWVGEGAVVHGREQPLQQEKLPKGAQEAMHVRRRLCRARSVDVWCQESHVWSTRPHAAARSRTQRFRHYLRHRGQALANSSICMPYFALPYVSTPVDHPTFQALLEPDWCRRLQVKLLRFLRATLPCVIVQPRIRAAACFTPQHCWCRGLQAYCP